MRKIRRPAAKLDPPKVTTLLLPLPSAHRLQEISAPPASGSLTARNPRSARFSPAPQRRASLSAAPNNTTPPTSEEDDADWSRASSRAAGASTSQLQSGDDLQRCNAEIQSLLLSELPQSPAAQSLCAAAQSLRDHVDRPLSPTAPAVLQSRSVVRY